jgi:hypothetical protein
MTLGQSLRALATTLCLSAPLFAQTTAAPPPRLTFDVASIHPDKADTLNGGIKPLPGGHGYTAQNVTVKLIISLMYRIPQRHTMFKNLLADRFGLKLHKDTREGNVYALTIDPSGLKMKPNATPEDYEIPMHGPPAKLVGKRVPMPYLCWNLGQALQNDARPVADETGLTGYYDFTLSYVPQLPPGKDAGDLPPEYKDLPSIFDAVKQQLGLRLTPQKGPVEHLVIDHIDKPSEN